MAQQKPHLMKEHDRSVSGDTDVSQVVKALSVCLSDLYFMLLKTQNFHWNVEGKNFYGMHKLTEEQYLDMQAAVDELAERIRALGYFAPGRFSVFAELSELKESGNPPYPEEALIRELVLGHETVVKNLRAGIETSEEQNDASTADLLTARLSFHEKAMWMLRAMLSSGK